MALRRMDNVLIVVEDLEAVKAFFIEPLKAWAVNPVFDSTRLRQPLLDICRMYEEMIN